MRLLRLSLVLSAAPLAGCYSISWMGSIERLDPRLDAVVPPGAYIEKVDQGFEWSEGPVWMPDDSGGHLLFSDIPRNTIFRWKEGEGRSVFMRPSGYTGTVPRGGELGTNGLVRSPDGKLVMCEHGNRRVSRLEEHFCKTILADSYQDRRLNSPNDAVFRSNGDLYFTDPPYGLEGRNNDPTKELDFNGVYRLTPSGELELLTKELSRPNGIAFSPDEKTLYVANSDPGKAIWMAFDVGEDGRLSNGRTFFDATSLVESRPGLPDGMAVDRSGTLFATGPGGVLVFAPDGTHLGTIVTGQRTANCTFGEDGSALYITADMFLCRVRTSTVGLGF